MPTGYKLYPNMKAHRSNYAALDITVLIALATVFIFATLATIFQMQHDMLAAESATQSVSSYQPHNFTSAISATWPYNQKE
jgi:hypothetical protein